MASAGFDFSDYIDSFNPFIDFWLTNAFMF